MLRRRKEGGNTEQQNLKNTSGYGANIRAARIKAGLSQSQLATLLHYNHTAISSWELNTRRPSYEALSAMAGIFECTVDEIILGLRTFGALEYLTYKKEMREKSVDCSIELVEMDNPEEAVRIVAEWARGTE